jgi:hypothetical protein
MVLTRLDYRMIKIEIIIKGSSINDDKALGWEVKDFVTTINNNYNSTDGTEGP